MPYEEMKARTIAIAKGKYKLGAGEPKVWFSSIKSLANVLSEENQALLQVIRDTIQNRSASWSGSPAAAPAI